MGTKLRVGIIGAGRMAYWHLKGYKKIKGVEIVGIAGKTRANIDKLQKKFKIPHAYTDYRALLQEQKPDAVSVATPTYTHCPIVIDSLVSGCHVFCEKPISMDISEADRMIEAEKSTQKIFMVGFSQRFYKEFEHIKKIIDRGELGNIKVAWFRRGINMPPQKWYSQKGESSGVTCELAIHAIDWLRWIINAKVILISAEVTEDKAHPGIDDNAWILLRFENGALGVVGASYSFPFLKRDIGVIGERMALTIERTKVIKETFGSYSIGMLALKFIKYSFIIPYWLYYNPFQRALAHFTNCICTGTRPDITSEDGKISLQIALKAIESAGSGKKIQVYL